MENNQSTYGLDQNDMDALARTARAHEQSGGEGEKTYKAREMTREEMLAMETDLSIDLSEVSEGFEPWKHGTWLCQAVKVQNFGAQKRVNEDGSETHVNPYLLIEWRCLHGANHNRTIEDRVMLGGDSPKALARFKIMARAIGMLAESVGPDGKKKSAFVGNYGQILDKVCWLTVEEQQFEYRSGAKKGTPGKKDGVAFAGFAHISTKPVPPELSGEAPPVPENPWVDEGQPAAVPSPEVVPEAVASPEVTPAPAVSHPAAGVAPEAGRQSPWKS